MTAWSGAVSAIIRIAIRTMVRADSVRWPASRWRAPVASTTKAVVRYAAVIMCMKRIGKVGLKMICSQSTG